MNERMNIVVALAVVCLTMALAWLLVGGSVQEAAQGEADKAGAPAASATQADVVQKATPPQGAAGEGEISDAAPAATQPALAPTDEEREQAAELLDFCNKASLALNNGWLGQADVLAFFTRVYLGEWQLPVFKPRGGKGSVTKALVPPDGIFTAEEKTMLAGNVQDMLKNLDAMLADYRKLEAYVMNPEVVDNGKLGKSLGAIIQKSHAAFAAARTAYLDLLRQRSRAAEDVFLFDHPLKRQIVAARHVFVIFSQMANILGLEKTDRERLQVLQDELQAEIATAAAPPFAAKPVVERPFRAFVAEAERFARLSQRGLESGYDNDLKRALNDAMVQSRENYNAFVRVANGD